MKSNDKRENLPEFACYDRGDYCRALEFLKNGTPGLVGVIDKIVGNLYEKSGILQEDAKCVYICGKLRNAQSSEELPVDINICWSGEDSNSITVMAMINEPVSLHGELKYTHDMYMDISRKVTIERGRNPIAQLYTSLISKFYKYEATITENPPYSLPFTKFRLRRTLIKLAKNAKIRYINYQRSETEDWMRRLEAGLMSHFGQ